VTIPLPYLVNDPDTVDHLSRVLTELLRNHMRSRLWKKAVVLASQQYDVESLKRIHAYGWNSEPTNQFNLLIERLLKSIPQHSELWVYYRSSENLRDALVEAVTSDALGLFRNRPGRKRGPKGYASYDEFVASLVEMVRAVRSRYPDTTEENVAAYILDHPLGVQRGSAAPDVNIGNKARWIRKHLQRTGMTWKDIINLACTP
jgi:hypothetical protein